MKKRNVTESVKRLLMVLCIGAGLTVSLFSMPVNVIAAEAGSYSIETDEGKVTFIGSRMLDESVPSGDSAGKDYVLLLYTYENYTTEPKMPHQDFYPRVYQNGVELDQLGSRTVNETEDSQLLDNYFKTVIKGGTLEYGWAYELTDDSPLTIILQENGSKTVEPVSFEVNIGEEVLAGTEEAAQEAAESEAVSSENAGETEAKAEAPEQPAMTVEELEAELSQQPVRFLDAEVSDSSDWRIDVSWDSGFIFPHVINESDDEIQHINTYYVAWDENNLPVTLTSRYADYKAGYTPNIILAEVNLVPGAKLNEDDADTFNLFPFDETCNVAKAKGIVAVYTTYSGDRWENPLLSDWLEIYGGGKKLVEPVIYTDAETVMKVQEALNAVGYDCGTPDGKAGDKTHAAMNEYQTQNGLPVTNDITDGLLVALGLAEGSDSEADAGATDESADSSTKGDSSAEPGSAEEIDALLQGTWSREGSGLMTFENSTCKITDKDSGSNVMEGEYTIDTEQSEVVVVTDTTDKGKVGVHFPYTLEGGQLTISDRKGPFQKAG